MNSLLYCSWEFNLILTALENDLVLLCKVEYLYILWPTINTSICQEKF